MGTVSTLVLAVTAGSGSHSRCNSGRCADPEALLPLSSGPLTPFLQTQGDPGPLFLPSRNPSPQVGGGRAWKVKGRGRPCRAAAARPPPAPGGRPGRVPPTGSPASKRSRVPDPWAKRTLSNPGFHFASVSPRAALGAAWRARGCPRPSWRWRRGGGGGAGPGRFRP